MLINYILFQTHNIAFIILIFCSSSPLKKCNKFKTKFYSSSESFVSTNGKVSELLYFLHYFNFNIKDKTYFQADYFGIPNRIQKLPSQFKNLERSPPKIMLHLFLS